MPAIQECLTCYQRLDRLSAAIEAALHTQDLESVDLLSNALLRLQEEAKAFDQELLEQMRQGQAGPDDQVAELLSLMESLTERNQRLMPHLSGFLAMQRDELHKLRQGNTLLRGYQPSSPRTGSRLSTSE